MGVDIDGKLDGVGYGEGHVYHVEAPDESIVHACCELRLHDTDDKVCDEHQRDCHLHLVAVVHPLHAQPKALRVAEVRVCQCCGLCDCVLCVCA